MQRGIDIYAGYGLSETCPVLSFAAVTPGEEEDVAARVRTGRPLPLVDLRIVDEEMAEQPRDGASTGEVVVRAPWLNAAYLKDEGASEALWRGGMMHTGDVGHIDAAGNLQITDRMKDVIKSGGEWVSSLALESIASGVSGVGEVAAIGNGASVRFFSSWVPRFVSEIAKTSVGKIETIWYLPSSANPASC